MTIVQVECYTKKEERKLLEFLCPNDYQHTIISEVSDGKTGMRMSDFGKSVAIHMSDEISKEASTDFLRFVEFPNPPNKTKLFYVYSAQEDEHLGLIYWRPGWRKYVMHFDEGCDWDTNCMQEANGFVKKLMEDRRKK